MGEIEEYIRNAMQKGFDPNQIEKKLLDAGYPPNVTKKLIKKEQKRAPKFPNVKFFIIVGIFIILVGTGFYFLENINLPEQELSIEISSENFSQSKLVPIYEYPICGRFVNNLLECLSTEYGFPADNFEYCGVYVMDHIFEEINPNSELKKGDVIISGDGIEVKKTLELYNITLSKRVGEEIILKTLSGKELALEVQSLPEEATFYNSTKKQVTLGYALTTYLCKK